MQRRDFLRTAALASPALLAAGAAAAAPLAVQQAATASAATPPSTGRLRHSVCRWCFGGMSLEDLCVMAKAQGVAGIDLLSENEWEVLTRFGMICTTANGPSTIPQGFNRLENHDRLVAESERLLPLVAAAGIPNMIVFSGNRFGMDDAEGRRNCAKGLKRIAPLAENLGVMLVMELLNSKVDHRDYMCDRTEWGAALVDEVGSDNFRLLYDIYHMQVMEGDVIRTIGQHGKAIAHYHSAGNPGRSNLDATQELYYPAIAKAIADSGFDGWFAHEFMPRGDKAAALREAVVACTV